MTHIAFQPRAQRPIEVEVDYAVVGSGAGGATAAVTLARAGAEVAIVEAGPWRDPEDYPHSVYGAMRDMLTDWGSTFTRGRAYWPVVQASLVGGSTVVNSAICVRTPGDVFARWERERGIGGDDMANALWAIQDQLENELFAEVVPEAALGKSNRMAMQAAQALGIEGHYMRRYVKGCEGRGQCLQGCRAGNKQSLNLNYVPETLQRGSTLLSCAKVERVRFEGQRAAGVEGVFRHPQSRARGARFTVRARRGVLVAASVMESPLLLLRSGLRLPALGRYFHAHPGTPMLGVYDAEVDMSRGATQGWSSLEFRDTPGFKLETLSLPLDMYAGRLAGGGEVLMQRLTEFRHTAMWVLGCRAESTGEVRPGAFGKPNLRYTLDRADMERLRAGLVVLARMHFAMGARKVVPSIFGLPYALGPDDIGRLEQAPLDPRAYVAILSHLFGGCAMGSDPRTAVCDERGRVHGVQGLYIADASAIPAPLGVNPQHTIMALARLFAEQMTDTVEPRHTPRSLSRSESERVGERARL
jgi:choline dehydrogenase-like flavoprotein